MTERAPPSRFDATLRVLAALAGTLPLAILGSVCLARYLPLGEAARFTLGFTLAIPLWVALMCWAFVARRAARAWGVCLATGVLLAAFAYGGR